MTAPQVIRCGGASPATTRGARETILNLRGPGRNIRVKYTDINRRVVQRITPAMLDLLDIAAYVFVADQACTRGGSMDSGVGARWRRDFRFRIPVREHRLWASARVSGMLASTLGFLSDDDYDFTFLKRTGKQEIQEFFDFSPDDVDVVADRVMLFSGGLDSLAGAIAETATSAERCVLVSHCSATVHAQAQRALVAELAKHGRAPLHVPVWVDKDKELSNDPNQRTRSFLFTALAATVASGLGVTEIRFYENGFTSINLPFSEQLVGARASRTTNPKVLSDLSALLTEVTGRGMRIVNPFVSMTKADVVKLIADAGLAHLIDRTVSCSRVRLATAAHPHCGNCMQCIERRFGVLFAGCGGDDPENKYRVELLCGPREDGQDKTMVESIVRTAQDMLSMTVDEFATRYPEVNRVLRCFPGGSEAALAAVFALHQRHAEQVVSVIKSGIATHAAAVARGAVDATALLSLLASRGERARAAFAQTRGAEVTQLVHPAARFLETEPSSTATPDQVARRLLCPPHRVTASALDELFHRAPRRAVARVGDMYRQLARRFPQAVPFLNQATGTKRRVTEEPNIWLSREPKPPRAGHGSAKAAGAAVPPRSRTT